MLFSFGTVVIRGARTALALAFASLPAQADIVADPIGNFERPVQVTIAPGAPRLLFVVEAAGRIQVLRDEILGGQPFLNIAGIVLGPPDPGAGGEQGLLSVAFAPDYPESGRFYVAFTNPHGAVEVDEFRRSADRPARADPLSRRILLKIPHRNAQNHNGGQLQFGPDGLLYISVGDGGTGGDNARDLDSRLGKILRIDPRKDGDAAYRIPADNPFVGAPGKDEIYAYGLRNPWRFSFDGKRIAIADVGQGTQEEINFLNVGDASGVNFGWPQYEGNLLHDDDRPGPHPPVFPMHVYSHDGGGCAVVGGFVVRDASIPELLGRYLYGDFCTGELRSFKPNVGKQEARDDKPAGLSLPQLSAFGRGHDGEIYAAQTGGAVSRIRTAP